MEKFNKMFKNNIDIQQNVEYNKFNKTLKER